MAHFWDSVNSVESITNIEPHTNCSGMIIIPLEDSDSYFMLSPSEAKSLAASLLELVDEIKQSL